MACIRSKRLALGLAIVPLICRMVGVCTQESITSSIKSLPTSLARNSRPTANTLYFFGRRTTNTITKQTLLRAHASKARKPLKRNRRGEALSSRSSISEYAARFPTFGTVNRDMNHEGVFFNPQSDLNWHLIRNIEELQSYDNWYESPLWLADRHIHTIFASKARIGPELKYRRVWLNTTDDGCLALDIVQDDECADTSQHMNQDGKYSMESTQGRTNEVNNDKYASKLPDGSSRQSNRWVLLLPGLGGGSEDSYVRSMAYSMGKQGWRVAILNMRGCGNSPVRSPRLFSANRGSVEDVRLAVSYIRGVLGAAERVRGNGWCRVAALGWSCGGSIVTNYAAVQGGFAKWERIEAGVALACPYDLTEFDKLMHSSVVGRYVYGKGLARKLIGKLTPYIDLFNQEVQNYCGHRILLDKEQLLKAESIRDIDRHLTVPLFGYDSLEQYYKDASSRYRLKDIRVPFLAMSAIDDPMARTKLMIYKFLSLSRLANKRFVC